MGRPAGSERFIQMIERLTSRDRRADNAGRHVNAFVKLLGPQAHARAPQRIDRFNFGSG